MIITTMNDSFDTAQSVLEDLQGGVLDASPLREGFGLVESILRNRGQCERLSSSQQEGSPQPNSSWICEAAESEPWEWISLLFQCSKAQGEQDLNSLKYLCHC